MRHSLPLTVGLLLGGICHSNAAAQAQPWRFGIEDTWAFFGGVLNPTRQQQLLTKMTPLVTAQSQGGDVNINGFAGGWGSMQPTATSTIDFRNADAPIQTLQAEGFSVLWNLRLNSLWASEGNSGCYVRSTSTNCAPSVANEERLKEYIRAIVERYDGDGNEDMGFETPLDTSDDLIAVSYTHLTLPTIYSV